MVSPAGQPEHTIAHDYLKGLYIMTIKQAYDAYMAELARNDAGKHGASLRMLTDREQELYDAWQAAIRDCNIWSDGEVTWHVLSRDFDGPDEMWHCRIVTPEQPEGKIGDCFAAYVRMDARPVEDETEQKASN
jgi:hypothetical protein